jgi:hypothetical protein
MEGKVCAEHARAAKTWYPLNPCRDCEKTDLKTTADNPPVSAGTLAKTVAGASKVACECWDRLEVSLGITLEHIHLRPGVAPTGQERTIPGTRYQADARDPDDENVLYEYLGNRWHGWPVGHARHNDPVSVFNDGRTTEELYDTTFERFKALKKLGYKIKYIWGNEYKETCQKKFPRALESVVHEF